MATILRCPSCDEPSAVTRAHLGHSLPCPACAAEIDVPRTLDLRGHLRESLSDRRSGYWAMTIAWISAIVFFLPVPVVAASVWWWASRRIRNARDDDREVPEPLLAARTIAAVGCVSQLATWTPWALRQFA